MTNSSPISLEDWLKGLGFSGVTVVQIEVSKGGVVKPDAKGNLRYLSPVPCPFNYGSVVNSIAPDGDPIDAVVLGPRRAVDERAMVRVFGVAECVDAGVDDPKYICGQTPVSRVDWVKLLAFFHVYFGTKRLLNRLRGRQGETRFVRLVPWTDA